MSYEHGAARRLCSAELLFDIIHTLQILEPGLHRNVIR